MTWLVDNVGAFLNRYFPDLAWPHNTRLEWQQRYILTRGI